MAINGYALSGTERSGAGTIKITADALTVTGTTLSDVEGVRTGLFATSAAGSPAGNIVLNVGSLAATNAMFTSSSTAGGPDAGRAGSVTIHGLGGPGTLATAITLDHSVVATQANAGAGGAIALGADTIALQNGSTVSSTSSGAGPNARGGNITFSGGQAVRLNGGSSITASSTGVGDAGNIVIHAGNAFVSQNGSVTTEATHASGGNITITARNLVQLTDSQINASVQGNAASTGGNIVIDPQFTILQNSQILAQATQGQGGTISITTNNMLTDAASVVSASSESGISGTVSVQSPISQAAGRIVPLSKSTLDTPALLNQRCSALVGGQYSSFVVAGRDTVPSEPGGWLGSAVALVPSAAGGTGRAARLPAADSLALRRLGLATVAMNLSALEEGMGCGS
jgi:large exoprotein involved in heme utilization and adhesion